MGLGQKIKDNRIRLGLTLERLSEMSGVDVGTIHALEKRDSSRSKYASALAAALGMTFEELEGLFTFSDAKDSTPETMAIESGSRLKQSADSVTIPQYNGGGSMGFGLALPDQPGIIHNWQVTHEWLDKNARAHSGIGNLRIVTGFGPSMQPMFNPGDPILVDSGVKSVVADGIYFFRVGQEGFIKQLQKIPTADGMKYVAKSKNPDYDSFEITEDMDFEVLGKVIRVWCGTDF